MQLTSYLFIINPVSGPLTKSWKEIIYNYFTEKSLQADYYILDSPPDLLSLENKIKGSDANVVVAVGGDGTVSMIANIIADSPKILGIIPAGSSNAMAKELNIPLDTRMALDIITTGQIKACDAIKINEKYICIHLCDIGINAQLIKYFEQGNLRGQLGYARMIIKTLWYKQKMMVTIYSGNRKITRDAFMIVLANASKYGIGAVINPTGQLDDGIFEVVVIRKLAFSELLKIFFRVGQFNPRKIEIISGTSVTLSTRRSAHFQIDGEYIGKVKRLDAKILSRILNIILPV